MAKKISHTRAIFFALPAISILLISFAYLLFTVLSSPVSAAPSTMNFQGRLLDATGTPVADGLYNMKFALYDASTSGTQLWTETRENTGTDYRVQVTNGLFTTKLGERTALTPSLFSSNSVYFEITQATPATATCSTAACATWESPMTPRHQLSTSAYAYNADTLDGLDSTAFAAATGSTNYIQNSTSPQTADFTITGSGTAGSLQAASLDTAAAGILTLGGTNTTSITFADSSVLAAGKTLTLTGSTTANRPASPTDGMLYYDTDTKQLLVYNTTLAKWVADGKDAIIVAASNSTEADKAAADYVTPGTADQTKIQQAVDAANPAGSGRKTGKVVLLAGTYSLTDAVTLPNNLTFAGVGRGTWLKFANIAGQTKNMLVNTDTTTGEGIVVRDLRLDGDKATNTTGTLSGISFNGVGGGSGATARQGAVITNVFVVNFTTDGIYLSNSANSNLSNSTTQANGSYGIRIGNCSRSVIANNITQGNTAFGMSIAGTSYMTINANTITDNTGGGVLFSGTATDNNFTSNSLRENGSTVSNNSIEIAPSTSNVDRTFIVGNSIYDSAGTGAAIKISDATADDTYLSNNTFSGAGAATISDAGTNTRYVGQTTSANATNVVYRQTNSATAFSIQNASATSLLTADTTNGNVLFGSYNAGTNPLAGKLVLANATNANTVSLVTGATSTSYTLTLPTATGSTGQCLYSTDNASTLGWTSCGGGVSLSANNTWTGVNLFSLTNTNALKVQNASAVSLLNADTSTMNVTIGSVGTPSTLTLTGSTTANRPTGSEGMLYYDTDTKQLLTYANGKWQADRHESTKIVAASNSSQAMKDAADYVASGTGDQATLNAAISAVNTAGGGTVYLAEGQYNITGSTNMLSNVALSGAGDATILKVPNATNGTFQVITESTNPVNFSIRNLAIDLNGTNQTGGFMDGIYLANVGSGSGTTATKTVAIEGIKVSDPYVGGNGVYLNTCKFVSLSKVNVVGGAADAVNGIYVVSSSYVTVSDSSTSGLGDAGVKIFSSSYVTVTGSIMESNGWGSSTNAGVYLSGSSSDVTIANSILRSNSTAVQTVSEARIAITNNSITGTAGTALNLAGSAFTVTGNTISGSGNYGISVTQLYNSVINDNVISSNGASGINFANLASNHDNIVAGNTITANTGNGIYAWTSTARNRFADNVITANTGSGVSLGGTVDTIVTGNTIYDNGGTGSSSGIAVSSATGSSITNNTISDTAGTGFAISISSSTSTYLSGNTFSGTGASAISDSGTATIWENQTDGAGNLINKGIASMTVGTSTVSSTFSLQGGMTATALPTPTAPTITTGGTAGTTSYSYTVTALDGTGETLASTAGSTATGNATLSATNYTIISWPSVSGATSYKIYRTASAGTPATTGLIATLTAKSGATQTTNDTGLAASGSSPTANTTGGATFASAIQGGSSLTLGTATTTNGSLVLKNANNANTVTITSGNTTASYSLTLPTALGSTGQCLSDTTGTGALGWATCSGGSLSTDTLTVGTATGITNMQKTAQTTAATAGAQFNIIGATGLNNTGGVLQLQGGAGNGTNMAGGAVTLLGGTPTGTGLNGAVSINGSGTGAVTIGSVTAGAVTITANAASNWGTNTGLLTITGAGGTTITTGTTNALTLNTGTTGAINMGTSGGAKTITIGNTTAASKLILTGAANTTTSNSNGIVIGSATTDATQINLELDSYNTLAETASTCTTTVNQGALYYNSSTATVRNCVDGTWQDVMSSSNLAAIVFGVVPDSGATPGDLVGLGASNNGTTGPCKVSVGAALTTVSWTACVAYTGFTNSGNTVRRVAITAGTATTTNAVAGNFQHLCLSRTTGQPALTTSAAENSFTVNASFTAAPQLCLADIKFAAANNTISGIYDTRVYTTTIKQFANVITTSPVLGGMVTVSTGDGTFVPTTGATSLISGVVVAQAGNVTANVVNTMIAIGGPVPIKATAGTRGQIILAGASGYATTSTTAGGAYTNAGVAQNSYSAACAINTDSCRGSLLTTLNVR